MVRYIFKRYGARAVQLTAAGALEHVVGGGVPQHYAVRLLSLAESRCRLLAMAREQRGSEVGAFPRTSVDGELSVEWIGNAPATDVHEIVQTIEIARDDADTGQFRALIDSQLAEDDTTTRQVLDGKA